jgi:hypothetical protein
MVLLAAASVFCAGRLRAQSNGAVAEHPDTLRGVVINSLTHEPIGRALVVAPDNRFAVMTDDRGQFEFRFAPPEPAPKSGPAAAGSFSQPQVVSSNRPNALAARKPGFLPGDNGGQVPLSPDQESITIALVPEALVVGHILLPSSNQFDRIQVELYRRELRQGREHWDNAGSANSRADGSVRFANLAAGSYKLVTRELLDRDPLTFDPRGQLYGYPPVYFPSAPDFAAAEVIHLAPGATFQANISPIRREYYRVTVALPNLSTGLQLQVSLQGHPGPGYWLGLNQQDATIEGMLPDGAYTIQAGTYGRDAATGTVNLSVRGGPATGSTMVLLPNPSVFATVKEEFQSPKTFNRSSSSPDLHLTTNSRRPNYLNLTLVSVEEFGFTPSFGLRPPIGPEDESLVIEAVRPGTYRVEANTSVGYIASVTSGGTDLLHKPLQVAPGNSPPPLEITVRDDGAEVEGTVEGVPQSHGNFFITGPKTPSVYFVPARDGTGQFRTAWAFNGSFQTQQLPPGNYRVFALDHQEPELQYATDEVLAQYEPGSQILYVSPGQKIHLRLSLIRSE